VKGGGRKGEEGKRGKGSGLGRVPIHMTKFMKKLTPLSSNQYLYSAMNVCVSLYIIESVSASQHEIWL